MKRKPIEIVSEILHYLQTIPPKSKISLIDVSKSTKTHYETIKEYVNLIQLVQINAPAITYNPKDRKIEIHTYPSIFNRFSIEERIILELFLNKRFDYGSAELLRNLSVGMSAEAIYEEIKTSDYFQIILLEDNMDNTRIYLRNKGKLKAHGLLASINRIMGEQINFDGEPIINSSETHKYEIEEATTQIDIFNQKTIEDYYSKIKISQDPKENKERPMEKEPILIAGSTVA